MWKSWHPVALLTVHLYCIKLMLRSIHGVRKCIPDKILKKMKIVAWPLMAFVARTRKAAPIQMKNQIIAHPSSVIVTGYSYSGTDSGTDYATIKYSSAGEPLWTSRYTGPGNYYDQAAAMGAHPKRALRVAVNRSNVASGQPVLAGETAKPTMLAAGTKNRIWRLCILYAPCSTNCGRAPTASPTASKSPL